MSPDDLLQVSKRTKVSVSLLEKLRNNRYPHSPRYTAVLAISDYLNKQRAVKKVA